MPALPDYKVSPTVQPKPEDYGYDLDRALASVMGLRAITPNDAFTAETLGTERAGNAVLIRENGVVLTIGYLITEAAQVWLHLNDGRVVEGHVLGYDQATGFGLVQALAKLDLPALPFGDSTMTPLEEKVVIGGAGGRQKSVAARVVGKQEFAGHWEYVLDEAIFTAPAHPNWGGTALIGSAGELVGIGSPQNQQAAPQKRAPGGQKNVPPRPFKPAHEGPLPHRPPQPPLAALARHLCHRGRKQHRHPRTGEPRPGAAGQSARRRHRSERCRLQGERSCRFLPLHLDPRAGRGGGAAADQPRRQDLRAAREI